MPKPRKPKPSFDIAPASEPIDTTWVYRTDDPVVRPVHPAGARPAPARHAVVDPAGVSPGSVLESVIDWMSTPFQLAVMLSLVPFGVAGRLRTRARRDS